MNSTNPKTYQVEKSTDPLMTTDTSYCYNYDVIGTQNCNGSLPQNSANHQNYSVMNKQKSYLNCYSHHQQASRDQVQLNKLQTRHYSTNYQFTGHYWTNDHFTGQYSTDAHFTGYYSTNAHFTG